MAGCACAGHDARVELQARGDGNASRVSVVPHATALAVAQLRRDKRITRDAERGGEQVARPERHDPQRQHAAASTDAQSDRAIATGDDRDLVAILLRRAKQSGCFIGRGGMRKLAVRPRLRSAASTAQNEPVAQRALPARPAAGETRTSARGIVTDRD